MSKIESAIKWMEDTAADDSHGYDQTNRWGPDYDCSAAVITAWQQAGVPVKTKGASYTGNMYGIFKKCGFEDVTTSVNLTTTKGLKRGDILLKKGHHVAMYCGNKKEVEASINELGKAVGGKKGDQTGKEFLVRSYRNYPWDCVLRYTAEDGSNNTTDKTITNAAATFKDDSAKKGKVFSVTADALYMRTDVKSAKDNKITAVLKMNEKVTWYGYYKMDGNTKWLYVTNGMKTGYCSSKYLKEV